MLGCLRWGALALALTPILSWAQPYSPPPSDFTAYWEEPAFKDFPGRGAAAAKGLILWSHGVSGSDPQWQVPAPNLIKDFARNGWDVIAIHRNNLHEAGWALSGTKHVAYLVDRISKARGEGYQSVIAAGQSYGGAISLEASAHTNLLFGIIALAPGHGSDSCGRGAGFSSRRISDNLQQMLVDAISGVKAPRTVVVVADGDECQGFNAPSQMIRTALQKTSTPFVHLDASMPIRGHFAGLSEQFRRWYGPCLMNFLDAAQTPAEGETKCVAPSPVPRFLFPTGYELPAPSGDQPDKLLGAWSGSVASATSSVDYNRDICVVIDKRLDRQIEGLAAFGAGPEHRLSMATTRRKFADEGGGYVYRGSRAYRMVLTPDAAADVLKVSITSAEGNTSWSGSLKHGC